MDSSRALTVYECSITRSSTGAVFLTVPKWEFPVQSLRDRFKCWSVSINWIYSAHVLIGQVVPAHVALFTTGTIFTSSCNIEQGLGLFTAISSCNIIGKDRPFGKAGASRCRSFWRYYVRVGGIRGRSGRKGPVDRGSWRAEAGPIVRPCALARSSPNTM